MKIFAISDLHLCVSGAKPMEIFGEGWTGYLQKIEEDWLKKVSKDDIVLIAGDLSWAMKDEDAKKDFEYLSRLPGKKIIIRGNHDYWWKSISKVRSMLPENIFALQNDAIIIDNVIICGTRGWTIPEGRLATSENKKLFLREVQRLEISLKCAKQLQNNDQKIFCMIHYPPFGSNQKTSELTKLIESYGVHEVVYGHLHGQNSRRTAKVKINKINYHLTSCDFLKNQLLQLK
ncbi:MAG: metallophosphoesterase [Clostridia bacterium]